MFTDGKTRMVFFMTDKHLSKSLWHNAQQLIRLVDDLYKTVSEPLGISIAEWHVLYALYNRDSQRPNELANAVGRATTSFTPILDSLERKGWIARQADPIDRRSVRIYLTEYAYLNRAQFDKSVTTLETWLNAQFDQSDIDHLVSLQERLAQWDSGI
jgi:DNA-binding MarR family transcriptional regulator